MSRVSDYFSFNGGKLVFSGSSQNIPDLLNPLPLLFGLLIIVGLLTFVGILLPLTNRVSPRELAGSMPLLCFFCSIGFGFMLIEISQLTRLSIFLGHPVFGLSVVSLFVSSGLGSLTLTSEVKSRDWIRLCLIVAALAAMGLVTPMITASTAGAPLTGDLLSIVVLSIPGLAAWPCL